MSDPVDVLALVTETRAKILRGEDVPLEELRQALEVVRKARAAIIGAKPPAKSKVPKPPRQEKRDLLEELFGGGPQ